VGAERTTGEGGAHYWRGRSAQLARAEQTTGEAERTKTAGWSAQKLVAPSAPKFWAVGNLRPQRTHRPAGQDRRPIGTVPLVEQTLCWLIGSRGANMLLDIAREFACADAD
jgi:hypothetical protein